MKRCPNCREEYTSNGWQCPGCAYVPDAQLGFPVLTSKAGRDGINFPEDAHAELAVLEGKSFWFRARNQLILWALKTHFSSIQRYLEIGCGTGYVLQGVSESFPGAKISGSEVYASGLIFAAERVKKAELMVMDARDIPYTDEFDVIAAFDVLEHIEDDDSVLAEMFRAIRPHGGVILTVPQHPWLWSRQDNYAGHIRRYHVGELRGKLHQNGFKVVFQTSFVSLLLPIMYMSRLFSRFTFSNRDQKPELRLPGLVNTLFSGTMAFERQLIKLGVHFPVGGSSIIIAKNGK